MTYNKWSAYYLTDWLIVHLLWIIFSVVLRMRKRLRDHMIFHPIGGVSRDYKCLTVEWSIYFILALVFGNQIKIRWGMRYNSVAFGALCWFNKFCLWISQFMLLPPPSDMPKFNIRQFFSDQKAYKLLFIVYKLISVGFCFDIILF